MRKLLLSVSIAMAIGNYSYAQTPTNPTAQQPGYVITGTIDSNYEGKIYLSHQGHDGFIKDDSTLVVNGRYRFTGENVVNPKLYFIQANEKYENKVAPFILENGIITIRTKNPKNIYSSEMGGTLNNAIFHAFIEQNNYSVNDSIRYSYAIERILKAQKGINLATDKEAFRQRSKLGTERSHYYQKVYFNKYKDQFFGLFLLRTNMCYRMSPQELETSMKSISPKFKDHPYTHDLKKILESKRVIPGFKAPLFETTDITGNKIKLSNFKGKVVLIDFWASWCGPCRRELPNVKEVYKKYGNRITIIGVSLDKDEQAWKNAIKKMQLDWIQVGDLKGWSGDIPVMYNVQTIPKAFLLDKNGIIRYVDLRGKELVNKVEELLSE